jgi:symplekin
MIPANHPLLDPRQLEAEATGLLDRMLGALQEYSRWETSDLTPGNAGG